MVFAGVARYIESTHFSSVAPENLDAVRKGANFNLDSRPKLFKWLGIGTYYRANVFDWTPPSAIGLRWAPADGRGSPTTLRLECRAEPEGTRVSLAMDGPEDQLAAAHYLVGHISIVSFMSSHLKQHLIDEQPAASTAPFQSLPPPPRRLPMSVRERMLRASRSAEVEIKPSLFYKFDLVLSGILQSVLLLMLASLAAVFYPYPILAITVIIAASLYYGLLGRRRIRLLVHGHSARAECTAQEPDPGDPTRFADTYSFTSITGATHAIRTPSISRWDRSEKRFIEVLYDAQSPGQAVAAADIVGSLFVNEEGEFSDGIAETSATAALIFLFLLWLAVLSLLSGAGHISLERIFNYLDLAAASL